MMKHPIISMIEATQEKKWPKQASGYVYRKGTDYKCEDCIFYKEKKCALYGPDVEIKPYGTCILWQQDHPEIEVPWLNTTTKTETAYEENPPGFSCKRCEEFIPDQKGCEKVDRFSRGDTPGVIHPDACCNRWEKK